MPAGQAEARETEGATVTQSSIARSSSLMAAGTLTSRLLGVVRLSLLGTIVGLSLSGDAFEVANSLPNSLYLLLAGGVLNAVLVPQITKAAARADGGEDYVNRLLTLALLLIAGATVVVTALAPVLTRLYWNADPSSPGPMLATALAFICLPQVFFYGLYTLIGQVLNARGRFVAYMWAPVVANLVAIVGLVWLAAAYPHELAPQDWTPAMIAILGGSATLGVVLQALVLLIPLHRSGFRYRPRFGFRGVGLRGASKVALWTLAAVALSQLAFVFTSNALQSASDALEALGPDAAEGGGRLGYGSAFLIFMLPHSLVTVSIVTALFPAMTRSAHEGRVRDLLNDLGTGMRMPAVVLLPITVGSVAFAAPVLQLLFHDKSAETIELLSRAVIAMMIGVIPYGWLYLIQRAFYAFEDARTPFVLQVLVSAVAVVAAFLGLRADPTDAIVVVGIGQTLGNLLAAAVGFVLLRRRVGPLRQQRTVRMYTRMTLATVLAALVTGPGLSAVGLGVHDSMPALVQLVLGGGALVALSLALAHLLRVQEVSELLAPVLNRLPGVRP